MKTVGSLLKEVRAAKGYTLEQVEEATKIRLRFLEAMEADDFRKLPSLAYAKGFVKNYAEFLGLDSRTTLAFFRRQTLEVSKSAILPKGVVEPLNRSPLQLTPGKFLALLVAGLVSIFLLYLGWQYKQIQQPPRLSLDAPADQLVTADKRIEVIGRTDPDATAIVNGVSVLVRSDGRFYEQMSLNPGVNKIIVSATSRFGKTVTVSREVGYQP